MSAEDLLQHISKRWSNDARDPSEIVRQLFRGVPIEFRVKIGPGLPFFLHRFNMIGVTILRRVWLVDSLIERPTVILLRVLRHEAVHVEQQAEDPISFYPRYFLNWLLNLVRPGSGLLKARRRELGRFRAAYRHIPAERIAYAREGEFRRRLTRELLAAGFQPDKI